MQADTPTWGNDAIQRWVALLDRVEALIHDANTHDLDAQRAASYALDSLVLHEHQMTPVARRRAREFVWLRDRPHEPLPDIERLQEWERCRCRRCLVERVLGHSDAVQLPPQAA